MKQEVAMVENSMEEIICLVNTKGYDRVLLVTGSHFDNAEWEKMKNSVKAATVHLIPPTGLLSLETIQSACKKLPWRPNLIIAIGGGRILDAAKLLIHILDSPRPVFVALPTTAGSGSEATPFAVVYKDKKKASISGIELLPDIAWLDAARLRSLPPGQRAISGIDALAQAIESIWNVHATKESTEDAKEALAITWNDLTHFVLSNEAQRDSRMLHASYMAGRAIAATKTTGCHALSYYLTAHLGVPHGQAVSIFLPAFFIYNDHPEVENKLKIIYEIVGVDNSADAGKAIAGLMRSCNLSTGFSELGIEVSIEKLLNSVDEERFANNPVPFNYKALEELITQYIV